MINVESVKNGILRPHRDLRDSAKIVVLWILHWCGVTTPHPSNEAVHLLGCQEFEFEAVNAPSVNCSGCSVQFHVGAARVHDAWPESFSEDSLGPSGVRFHPATGPIGCYPDKDAAIL